MQTSGGSGGWNLCVALLVGLATAGGACSSTAVPPDAGGSGGAGAGTGGHAGAGGTAGTAGTGGTSGTGGGAATCQSLRDDYAAAFALARTCNAGLANVQCTQLASPSLQCRGCTLHVNDTTRLDAIRAEYDARTDCPPVPCPAILCVEPGTGACVASDSGLSGSCIDVR